MSFPCIQIVVFRLQSFYWDIICRFYCILPASTKFKKENFRFLWQISKLPYVFHQNNNAVLLNMLISESNTVSFPNTAPRVCQCETRQLETCAWPFLAEISAASSLNTTCEGYLEFTRLSSRRRPTTDTDKWNRQGALQLHVSHASRPWDKDNNACSGHVTRHKDRITWCPYLVVTGSRDTYIW